MGFAPLFANQPTAQQLGENQASPHRYGLPVSAAMAIHLVLSSVLWSSDENEKLQKLAYPPITKRSRAASLLSASYREASGQVSGFLSGAVGPVRMRIADSDSPLSRNVRLYP
jgi:hypothetical protein